MEEEIVRLGKGKGQSRRINGKIVEKDDGEEREKNKRKVACGACY